MFNIQETDKKVNNIMEMTEEDKQQIIALCEALTEWKNSLPDELPHHRIVAEKIKISRITNDIISGGRGIEYISEDENTKRLLEFLKSQDDHLMEEPAKMMSTGILKLRTLEFNGTDIFELWETLKN